MNDDIEQQYIIDKLAGKLDKMLHCKNNGTIDGWYNPRTYTGSLAGCEVCSERLETLEEYRKRIDCNKGIIKCIK